MTEPKGSSPRKRAERIVEELAKRGETRAKGIQKAARDFAERSARDQRELMRLIQKEIRRQVEALGLARNAEVERLRKRVNELERKRDPKTSPKKPSAKPAARKPRAPKKPSS
jgi:polyhydroxyalkanoate synthesis regulator phasin